MGKTYRKIKMRHIYTQEANAPEKGTPDWEYSLGMIIDRNEVLYADSFVSGPMAQAYQDEDNMKQMMNTADALRKFGEAVDDVILRDLRQMGIAMDTYVNVEISDVYIDEVTNRRTESKIVYEGFIGKDDWKRTFYNEEVFGEPRTAIIPYRRALEEFDKIADNVGGKIFLGREISEKDMKKRFSEKEIMY